MINLKTICIINILVTIYLLIKYVKLSYKNKKTIENMANSDVDFEAIKSLGTIAKGLVKGGFKIPGNLTIDGNLVVRKNTSSKTISGVNYIKTYKLVPKNGNPKKNYFTIEKKYDGAYLLPPRNNTGGIGKPGKKIDDLYVDGHANWG